MIYDKLAQYYDALVKDEQATKLWVEFTTTNISGDTILELACGSAEISYMLADRGFKITASDISESMLTVAKRKNKCDNIKFECVDMCSFKMDQQYDSIICYCDSINYLNDINDVKKMFSCVYNSLKKGGRFLFDMHTPDRLVEFTDPFIEEGVIDDTDYQWTISTFGDEIHHHFAFWENSEFYEEFHVQKVFNYNDILNILHDLNFKVEVFTDFDKKGLCEGEKYFIIGEKI